jgi:hypothetical protein
MMRLLRVELARWCSRRAVALLLLAAAVFTGVVVAQAIWDTRPPTAGEHADAQAQSDMLADEDEMQAELAECQRDPTSYLGPRAGVADCRAALVPSAESLLPREELSLRRVLNGEGPRIAVLLAAVMVLAGATYAGSDWSSDSISTQLTFQPSRLRVWLAKATVATVASGLAAAVVLAGYWGALFIAADVRDVGVTDATARGIGWLVLRAVALAAAGGLGSYALTMLFRHTVATLGLLFAYAAGGEVLINLLPIHGASRWSVGNNVYGWLKDGFQYIDPAAGCRPFTSCDAAKSLSHADAAWFLGALLVVAVVASLASFVRRDV